MSRINSNVNSLIAQRVLSQQNQQLTRSLERLSTGLAINRGGDNPAGLIASERLRSEKAGITAGISNAERADQVVNIAEAGLQELSSALTELQSLVQEVGSDAGVSAAEKEANQQQVDQILQTIDRIASTTSFSGVKLLNGNFDFRVTSKAATVADYQVNGAKISKNGTVAVQAIVTNSAQHGALFLSAGATSLNLTNASSRFTFELGGAKGTREFSFASGTTLAAVATAVNSFKSVTGVSAVASGNYLEIKSDDFGSDQFISFLLKSDGGQAGSVFTASTVNENQQSTASAVVFATAVSNGTAIRDTGQDVSALINGVAARGKGKVASIATDSLDLSIELTTAGAQALAAISAFTIQDSGATFNLGPAINVNNQVRLGITNVAARNLGSATLGRLNTLQSGQTNNLINGNLETSSQIIDKAIEQVSQLRGRLGSFQKFVIGSTINSLSVALENTSAAESAIRDTDFAKETANLTRNQILVAAATQALGISNNQPQNVLKLIG